MPGDYGVYSNAIWRGIVSRSNIPSRRDQRTLSTSNVMGSDKPLRSAPNWIWMKAASAGVMYCTGKVAKPLVLSSPLKIRKDVLRANGGSHTVRLKVGN